MQELTEINLSTTESRTWTRIGPDLASAEWKTADLVSNVPDHLEYLNSLISELASKKALYDGFISDVSSGEYKFWKTLPKSTIDSITTKITLTGTGTPFQSSFKKDRYYKVYLNIDTGTAKFKDFIEISPEDHSFLSVGEKLQYSRVTGLELRRVQSHTSELIIPSGVTVTGISESYKLSI